MAPCVMAACLANPQYPSVPEVMLSVAIDLAGTDPLGVHLTSSNIHSKHGTYMNMMKQCTECGYSVLSAVLKAQPELNETSISV